MNQEDRYPVIRHDLLFDEFTIPGMYAGSVCKGWDDRIYRLETLGVEVRIVSEPTGGRQISAFVEVLVEASVTNQQVDALMQANPNLVPWIWSYGRNQEVPR